MKEFSFTIEGRLPSINDYTKACRSNKFNGASMKKKWQNYVIETIQKYMTTDELIDTPVSITFKFYEPNKRRDIDNIQGFAVKVVNDALSKTILPDDRQRYVKKIISEFDIDKNNPRIEVVVQTL